MTVQELIDALSEFNPNTKVAVACEHGGDPHPVPGIHGGTRLVTIRQVASSDWNSLIHDFVKIGDAR